MTHNDKFFNWVLETPMYASNYWRSLGNGEKRQKHVANQTKTENYHWKEDFCSFGNPNKTLVLTITGSFEV